MGFTRVYTGADGQSHFEDLDLLPADVERSVAQVTTTLTFGRSPNGYFHDYHNAPRVSTLYSCQGVRWRLVSATGR